jgi:NADH-quinone oxidoreductase subunit N
MRFLVLAPELALALAAAAIVALTLTGSPTRGRWARRLLALGLLIALGAASWSLGVGAADDFLFAAYRVDGFSQLGKALVAALGLVAMQAGRADDGQWAAARADGALCAALTALGLTLAVSAADLLVLLLALELAGLAFVGHIAAGGRRAGVESPARRVLVPRLAATLLMFAGIVVLAGLAGSTRFDDVATLLAGPAVPGLWVAGVALAGAGLFAALGVPPFHTGWLALETSTAPGVAGFGATALWATAALVTVRLAAQLGPHDATFGAGLAALGAVTVALGLARAARAPDVRRLLADLGLVQAGSLLAALAPQTREAWAGAALLGLAAPLGYATATLALARAAHGRDRITVPELTGLARSSPLLGLAFVLALATLAGIPPGGGFTARWAAVTAAWREGWYASAVVVVLAAAGGAWVIVAPLRALLAREPRQAPAATRGDRAVLAAFGVLLLAIGTMPAPVFAWAARLVSHLR